MSYSPECFIKEVMDPGPMIQICATMWHETQPEMVKMLTSFFRLDVDQMELRESRRIQKVASADYYEFEAHIFFDDAMTPHAVGDVDYEPNNFVKAFVGAVHEAARVVHKGTASIPPPTKTTTPYGGRLVWCMPGGNNIVVHLKDKVKVRNKKRWSQVMSMYYHLLCPLSPGVTSRADASRTYLLHVDGDVDFRPDAVHILLDLMNRDPAIGAVCGRTHPTGKGPLVWCQQFEYGLSHWLQKATEDVLGCVLCCPGCFSLLRGSALLQVLDSFTAPPTRPRQYLLEDQGEDRWLCSLLIQTGWRVQYSSSAECWTRAPESLKELYNQRRRWTPSGFFHTTDLIARWREYTKGNAWMSGAYVVYQTLMFVISILAGSLILLVLSGALEVVTQGIIELHYSVIINLVPIIVMGTACILAPSKIQLLVASVMTAVYAVLQCLMLGFSIYTAYREGICSPPSVFLIALSSSVLLAGLLHPTELFYILCGFLYFLFAPSMYLLQMIYALSNLHVVSWGTREVKKPKATSDTTAPAPHTDISTEKGVTDQICYDGPEAEELPHKTHDKWIQSEALGHGPTEILPEIEREFFQTLLDTHLKPVPSDSTHQTQITTSLKQLRNKTILAYYLINGAFLAVVLTLEAFPAHLSVPWPCADSPTVSPLGVVAIGMIFVALSVQVVGMVVHRVVSARRECSRKGWCAGGRRRGEGAAGDGDVEAGGAAGVYTCTRVGLEGVGNNTGVFVVDDFIVDDFVNLTPSSETSGGDAGVAAGSVHL